MRSLQIAFEPEVVMRKCLAIVPVLALLAAVAVRADDIGYVACYNHSENIQVLPKAAANTSQVVAILKCDERFTILLYGEVFSRIQTKDGKAGYIYSYLIARDTTIAIISKSPDYTNSATIAPAPLRATAAPEAPPPPTACQTLPDSQTGTNGNLIAAGSRLYIAPMDGFETYLAAAIQKKSVPVTLTLDNCSAAYAFATAEQVSDGWVFGAWGNRQAGAASGGSTRTVEASVMLVNMRTRDIVWAYTVYKSSNGGLLFGTLSLRGQQSAAEACAKHLKEHVR